MTNFPVSTLGELCSISIGRTPPRQKSQYWGPGFPWLSIADMSQGRNLSRTKEEITEAAAREVMGAPARPGTVALSFKLSIGKVGIITKPMYTNEAIATLPIKDPKILDGEYLYWALQSANLLKETDDAVMGKTLNKAKLARVRLSLPPIEQQRRIVHVLDQADELRTKRRQAIALLCDLEQSIFLNMFGNEQKIFQQWPSKPLGDLLDFLTSGSRGWARFYVDSPGDKFIRIQNVRKNELVLDDLAFVLPPDTKEATRTQVMPGDVVLSITADLGRTAVIPDNIGRAFINQHLSILRTSKIEPHFLSAYLASPSGQEQIHRRNRQGVKAGLNFDDIRSFSIPIPPIEAQRRLSDLLHQTRKLREYHRFELAKLDELLVALQAKAFRGEL